MTSENELLGAPLGDMNGSVADLEMILRIRKELVGICNTQGVDAYKSAVQAKVASFGSREAYLLGAAMTSAMYMSQMHLNDGEVRDPIAAFVQAGEFVEIERTGVLALLEKLGRWENDNSQAIANRNYAAFHKSFAKFMASCTPEQLIIIGGILTSHFL